jgi:hypothetical protein
MTNSAMPHDSLVERPRTGPEANPSRLKASAHLISGLPAVPANRYSVADITTTVTRR